MRNAQWLWLAIALCAACGDDDDANVVVDSGVLDGGDTKPADASSSQLLKPALPRAPGSGLPAELRPPR